MSTLPRERWFERTFRFDVPVERLPVLLDRLRGAVARVEAHIRAVPEALLKRRVDGTWSIQENIGHLADLEELHHARLDDLAAGATTLRAADVENKATWRADHNSAPIERTMDAFRATRARLVERLEAWDPARLGDAGLHPRLKIPMHVVDVAFFTAEHDDYHLARIHELLGLVGARGDRGGRRLFMVVERFDPSKRDVMAERFARQGRMLPEGVAYEASWLPTDGAMCWQLMSAASRAELDAWIARWSDVATFEVSEVEDSAAYWARRRSAKR